MLIPLHAKLPRFGLSLVLKMIRKLAFGHSIVSYYTKIVGNLGSLHSHPLKKMLEKIGVSFLKLRPMCASRAILVHVVDYYSKHAIL